MPDCDGAGMNPQIAVRHRSRAAWSPGRFCRDLRAPGIVLFAALSLGLWWSWPPPTDGAPGAASANQLVHWQDAGHDWLLVVDPSTRELVVYDASDGRPLDRFGADDGLPQVRSIALRGPWLYVTGQAHAKTRLLRLPELQAIAANAD
jgi:hypothetical protein